MSKFPNQPSELEALFQAARQLEAKLLNERAQNTQSRAEIEAKLTQQSAELAQVKQYVQKLLAHDQKMRQHLAAVQNHFNGKIQAATERGKQLEQANAHLSASLKEKSRQTELDLQAAKAALHQLRQKNNELETQSDRLKPELIRTREELERTQAEILEREHRYQTSVLTYQDRDRSFHNTIEGLKDQLRRSQAELAQFKSRWLETEKLRQDSEKLRGEAEQNLRRQMPSLIRLRELEEAHRSLEQRLMIERRQREQADAELAAKTQEREAFIAKLRFLETRLSRTEAELTKASAEANLLRAARRAQPAQPRPQAVAPAPAPPRAPEPEPSSAWIDTRNLDFESIERLALTGYRVSDKT